MSYLEEIKELGLEIITREEFLYDDSNKGLDYIKILRRWINISKGHPFCFVKRGFGNDSYFSLDFLLESGIIVPKNYNVEEYLENRCTEYFINKFEHRGSFKDEKI